MKVLLIRQPPHRHDLPGGHLDITHSLPFFQNKPTGYVHRVRSARHHFWDGLYSHTSVHFWCGGHAFAGGTSRLSRSEHRRHARFLEDPSAHSLACATCEGRAIGAGQLGSRMLCGRMLMFAPRV